MPLLLSHASARFCSLGSTPHASDTRHSKGDVKGSAFGASRGKAAAALFGSLSCTPSPLLPGRLAAVPSHQDAAADTTSLSAAAAAGSTAHAPAPAQLQDTSSDAEWEAVRLMTAARILSASSDDDAATSNQDIDESSSLIGSLSNLSELSLSDLSVGSSSAPPAHQLMGEVSTPSSDGSSSSSDRSALGALAYLDEIRSLDADSLALAVGILRQHLPLDAGEDDVQLSERLRDFLMVLRRRPGHSPAHSTAATAAAAASASDDVFGAADDEWADVRAALMGIGINASLDEEDDEDVWALEAGRVKTRRTRLLRSLPKLDNSTAQQLTAFLSEVQQHSSSPGAPPTTHQGTSSTPDAGQSAAGAAAEGVSAEEEEWWQQASLAYSLLRQQAGKVQEQEQGAEQQ